MSNDNHSDDDFIAQLYNSSKKEGEPPAALDNLILAAAKQAVVDTSPESRSSQKGASPKKASDTNDVTAVVTSIDPNIVTNIATNIATKNPTKKSKKRWFVPNSLVACLVVSVMVGLIYRENSGHLTISDGVEVDYYAPGFVEKELDEKRLDEKNSYGKADAVIMEEEMAEESAGRSAEAAEVKTEVRRAMPQKVMKHVSKSLGSSVRLKESAVMSDTVSVSESAPEMTSEITSDLSKSETTREKSTEPSPKSRAEFKAKKKMLKSERVIPLPRQSIQPMLAAPIEMQMMDGADSMEAETIVRETIVKEHLNTKDLDADSLESQWNKIRDLRDSGDLGGALTVLNRLVSQYPNLVLPEDIAALTTDSSITE